MALARDRGKTGDERSGRGFTSPAATARRRLAEAASTHGFAEPEVLLRWTEVVGERLAGTCTPVKVTYPRGEGLGATLVVRASGPRAIEVEHLGPQIVERVNRFYGYRAVGRVKVTQTTAAPTPGFAEPAPGFTGPEAEPTPADPTPADTARAADLTKDIRSDALREALTRMAAHVLSRGAGPAKD